MMWISGRHTALCVLRAVCCVLCAVCRVLCAVCCVLCALRTYNGERWSRVLLFPLGVFYVLQMPLKVWLVGHDAKSGFPIVIQVHHHRGFAFQKLDDC